MPEPAVADGITAPVRNLIEFPVDNGKVILSVQGGPRWVEPTLRTLGQLLLLPTDWDSFGGRAVHPSCVWSAWDLLRSVMRPDSPAPAVVPTNRGGVQLEWHSGAIDVEIEIEPSLRIRASYEDSAAGTSWEEELNDNFVKVAEVLARLAPSKERGA